MRSYRSALEAEQQRERIPKDVLALLDGNRFKKVEQERRRALGRRGRQRRSDGEQYAGTV